MLSQSVLQLVLVVDHLLLLSTKLTKTVSLSVASTIKFNTSDPLTVVPNAVDNFVISEETPVSNRTVQFNITWEKPSDRNGSFHYILEYKGMQTGRYPPFRRQKDGPRTVKLDDGNQEIYIFENALPFAEYDITLTAVNTKLNRSGPSVNDTRRTIAIGRALLRMSRDY